MLHLAFTLQSHGDCRSALLGLLWPQTPLEIVQLIGTYLDGGALWDAMHSYEAAATYLNAQPHLTSWVLLRTYRKVSADLHNLTFADRKFWLLCGDAKFPPVCDIRSKLDAFLGDFYRDENMPRLVHRLLGMHPFRNGNGRVARLLLSWRRSSPLLLQTDNASAHAWRKAVAAHTSHELAALVRNERAFAFGIRDILNEDTAMEVCAGWRDRESWNDRRWYSGED